MVRTRAASFRMETRTVLVCAAVVALALLLAAIALATGDFAVPLPEVLRALSGAGDPMTQTVVVQWRLPRVLMALVLGAALGMSGAFSSR